MGADQENPLLPPAAPHRINRRSLLRTAVRGGASLMSSALVVACTPDRRAVVVDPPESLDFAPPFSIAINGALRPLWSAPAGASFGSAGTLTLGARMTAKSPRIESTPGAAYRLRFAASAPVQLYMEWDDVFQHPLSQNGIAASPSGTTMLVTPQSAHGLRLVIASAHGPVTITSLSLVFVSGVRVESFPDYQRAAFAFSFDWESAMGGLIHSRSGAISEGEAQIALQSDGSPDVMEAEAKGLRMREGAQWLADQFARHDIRATFYATGYNFLTGNPQSTRFLGNPLYPNADTAHGWGSDWWKTHPWYGDDPGGTEATHPAWYFATQTRALAAAGHELGSHTFGHLYVRGVKPEQLDADLMLWQQVAANLGITAGASFAFPWTSSNSLDDRFWVVFARREMTVLTRRYPPEQQHAYEVDPVGAWGQLAFFPDFYLPSKANQVDEALAHIEETIARRGYHSLWTHPNEVREQDGEAVWSQVITAVAEARQRGLWVAPITEIVTYLRTARQVLVTVSGDGRRIAVTNRADHSLSGLTLTLPEVIRTLVIDGQAWTDIRAHQVRLPPLTPGKQVELRWA